MIATYIKMSCNGANCVIAGKHLYLMFFYFMSYPIVYVQRINFRLETNVSIKHDAFDCDCPLYKVRGVLMRSGPLCIELGIMVGSDPPSSLLLSALDYQPLSPTVERFSVFMSAMYIKEISSNQVSDNCSGVLVLVVFLYIVILHRAQPCSHVVNTEVNVFVTSIKLGPAFLVLPEISKVFCSINQGSLLPPL